MPSWQAAAGLPPASANEDARAGRGVPDVAGRVGPVETVVQGKFGLDLGTSAVAPLWAGLVACVNQALGITAGYFNPLLYHKYAAATLGDAFRDIMKGENAFALAPGYEAQAGWDACTGFGSPVGEQLLQALQ